MKYSENRKIAACVTHDRDSLERKNLWALLCMCFIFITLFSVVQKGYFFLKFA